MPKKAPTSPASEYIFPLYINRLQGRMLRVPNKRRKREILIVYDYHSTLERWWGLADDLRRYGSVTMPDLPGFGGMDSFYKIGTKPSLDNLADYLAAFLKLQYKRKQVTILGIGYGFAVVTRMLQRYPALVPKVEILVSVGGYAHKEDFTKPARRRLLGHLRAALFSSRLAAIFYRNVLLHPSVVRLSYRYRQKNEMARRYIDFEIYLWHRNDVRTRMRSLAEMLRLDNCRQQVALPLYHVALRQDPAFDHFLVEQHLGVIYSKVHVINSRQKLPLPLRLAAAKSAPALVPQKIRNLLAKS